MTIEVSKYLQFVRWALASETNQLKQPALFIYETTKHLDDKPVSPFTFKGVCFAARQKRRSPPDLLLLLMYFSTTNTIHLKRSSSFCHNQDAFWKFIKQVNGIQLRNVWPYINYKHIGHLFLLFSFIHSSDELELEAATTAPAINKFILSLSSIRHQDAFYEWMKSPHAFRLLHYYLLSM